MSLTPKSNSVQVAVSQVSRTSYPISISNYGLDTFGKSSFTSKKGEGVGGSPAEGGGGRTQISESVLVIDNGDFRVISLSLGYRLHFS